MENAWLTKEVRRYSERSGSLEHFVCGRTEFSFQIKRPAACPWLGPVKRILAQILIDTFQDLVRRLAAKAVTRKGRFRRETLTSWGPHSRSDSRSPLDAELIDWD
jgi:hypothetical protein